MYTAASKTLVLGARHEGARSFISPTPPRAYRHLHLPYASIVATPTYLTTQSKAANHVRLLTKAYRRLTS